MNEELKKLSEGIIKQIPTGERNIESSDIFEVDGIKYSYDEEEELDIEDEGKYQYGGCIYAIGLLDEEKGYGVKGEPLFYMEQDFSRSGSYFSDYYYDYEEPYVVEKVEKVVTITSWKRIE